MLLFSDLLIWLNLYDDQIACQCWCRQSANTQHTKLKSGASNLHGAGASNLQDNNTVNDATAFLETFFKLYPTATEKELAYYVAGNLLEPIGKDYLYSELVNPIFTKDGDNVKVKVAVKFLDNQTKATQVSQYELVLYKDSNWKIIG